MNKIRLRDGSNLAILFLENNNIFQVSKLINIMIYRLKLPLHGLLIKKCPMKSLPFFIKCLLFCLVQLTIELSHIVYLYRKLFTIDQVRNLKICVNKYGLLLATRRHHVTNTR
ncbi:MAG: hypothetical protein DSY50_00805, partial [Desulfobulbus sp.]